METAAACMNQRMVLKFMFKTLECTTKIHFGANELPTIGSFEGDAGHPKTEGAMRLAVAWYANRSIAPCLQQP